MHPLLAQQAKGVAFTIIDTPPKFEICKGANVIRLKECFKNNVDELISENVDFNQFEKSLPKGLHRVFVTFTISDQGILEDLNVRTPYRPVQIETAKALALIPRLTPAIHKNSPSDCGFATAFTIEIKNGKPLNNEDQYGTPTRKRNVDY